MGLFGKSKEKKSEKLCEKGGKLISQEKYEEAISCYDKVIAFEDPYHSESALFDKGTTLFQLERYEEAIACYDEVNKGVPEYLEGWNLKGHALKKLGREKEAEECFAKAKELDES